MQPYSYRPGKHLYTGSLEAEIGGYGGEEVQEVFTPRKHRPARQLRNTEEAVIAEQRRNKQRIDKARAGQRNLRSNTRLPTNARPLRQRQDVEEDELYGDEELYTQHSTRSAIRWQPGKSYQRGNIQFNEFTSPPPAKPRHAIPARRSAQAPEEYEAVTEEIEEQQTGRVRRRPKIRFNPLVWLGLGMIAMIFLWIGYSNALNWWQIHQDDSNYGRPRTFQIDAVVGHNDGASNPSHFEAINLNRHIIVIELPGGDPTKARIYPVTTLFGDGQDLTPVTLSFKDVDRDELIDMEIHIENQTLVMINDNGIFRPLKAGERVHL